MKANAGLLAANAERAALESLSQTEKDELERRARDERRRMVEEAERKELEEERRLKQEIVDALAHGSAATAEEIRQRGEKEKVARAEALAKAVPPSLSSLYASILPTAMASDIEHSPLSPNYAGPWVAMPYADLDNATYTTWYDLKEDYVDGRRGVRFGLDDKDGTVRPGGYDLSGWWHLELRAAVEGLAIEPIPV